jgi:hypothetical protein
MAVLEHNLYFMERAKAEEAHAFITGQFDEEALLVEHDQEQYPTGYNYEVAFWTIAELDFFTRMDILHTTRPGEWSFNELEDVEA